MSDIQHDASAPNSREIEPEGLDTDAGIELDDYPLDSVMIRTETRTVAEVVKRIENRRWVMDPDFQRDFVWEPARQSRLIQSCLMRIPLPVFYLAEDREGRVIVVDGLQRLTTFCRYLEGSFALKGLGSGEGEAKKEHPLNGKKVDALPIKLKERIEDTQLTLYILDSNTPPRAKLDIFERVNSGVPLSRQQMRNALYVGRATKWLQEVSDNEIFLEATGGSLSKKTMRDREAINRFCGFYLRPDFYTGDMDAFLADTLDHMNKMTDDELYSLKLVFLKSMQINSDLFGKHAFRKSLTDPDGDRAVINIALFDACSVLFAKVDSNDAKRNEDLIRERFDDLLSDEEFYNSITLATNSVKNVNLRFDRIRSITDIIDIL